MNLESETNHDFGIFRVSDSVRSPLAEPMAALLINSDIGCWLIPSGNFAQRTGKSSF